MPRFFFDISYCGSYHEDEVGVELAGLDEAKDQALQTLPDVAKYDIPDGNRRDCIITVRDETGRRVLIARLYMSVEAID
jgi:Domain of unknown function (DUF6894)